MSDKKTIKITEGTHRRLVAVTPYGEKIGDQAEAMLKREILKAERKQSKSKKNRSER